MEGTWDFVALEMDAAPLYSISFRDSHLLIDGDRFYMRSPEANYEGIFIIDVEAQPHAIDIQFVEGPEAGKSSYGLFELDGENMCICVGLTGIARPAAFATSAGSGHALERLVRSNHQRPADLSSGQPPSKTIGAIASDAPQAALDEAAFEFSAAPIFDRLAGNWLAVEAVRDGQALPASTLAAGKRVGSRNETKVSFGGRVMIDARMRIDITCTPLEIDYLHTSGAAKGKVQHGIMAWVNDDVRFCMAAPGDLRPTDFSCRSGSGRTLSTWRRA